MTTKINALVDDLDVIDDWGEAQTATEAISQFLDAGIYPPIIDNTRESARHIAAMGVAPGDVNVDGVCLTFAHRALREPARIPTETHEQAKLLAVLFRLALVELEETNAAVIQ